jgi:hypothetical protein
MQFNGPEKRRHPRYDFCDMTECCLNSLSPAKFIFCPSVDFCESGVCIYTSHRLNEGEPIEISNSLTVSHQKAVVKWVNKCDEDFYKTGLMFVN